MVDSAMRAIHSDVAIIGGGLVGTWAAYFLRKRGRSVAVIGSTPLLPAGIEPRVPTG